MSAMEWRAPSHERAWRPAVRHDVSLPYRNPR
jgi:hypothetical protein